jgi:predicted small lipoprotein YifL
VKSDIKFPERRIMRTVGIMLLLTIILQGCGRKGPLFLPVSPNVAGHAAPAQPAIQKPESK